mgnify:CR=1 FL=1
MSLVLPERSALRKLDVNTLEIDEQSSSAIVAGSRRSTSSLMSLPNVYERTIDLLLEEDLILGPRRSSSLHSLARSAAGSRRASLNLSNDNESTNALI